MKKHGKLIFLLLLGLALQAVAQDIRISPYGALQLPEENKIVAMAFLSNGKILVVADDDGNVGCWDLEKKILLNSSKLDDPPLFLAASGDRSYVAVDGTGKVVVQDILKGQSGTIFQCKGKPVRVALDAGMQFLAVATDDEKMEIFDVKAMMPAGTIDVHDKLDDLLFLGFDRLGQQIVAIRKYGEVVSWNPATLKLLRELTLAGGELHGSTTVVHAAATNRAANVFAAALEEIAIPKGGVLGGQDLMRNYTIVAYDWNSGVELKRVKTNWPVEQMVMGPGNDHLTVTNEDDNSVTLVDLRKGEVGSSVTMEQKPLVLAISEDNAWMAAGTKHGLISVWQMKFKDETRAATAFTPSLGGRIRARGAKDPALTPGVPVKIAIMGFEGKGVSSDVADVCVASLANALANVDYITLVERREIEKIINEQKFQLSGLTEEEGVEVGKISKADVVLLGNVGTLGSSLVLSARLISVTTGKVLKAREVVCEECRDQDIYDAITTLASTIAQ
jgi:TolB-like protein